MPRTSGWGGSPRCFSREASSSHYFALLERSLGTAHGPLRRSVRLDVAFRLASGRHLSGAGAVPSPAFGGRVRNASSGRVDGATGLARAPRDAATASCAGPLFAFHVTLEHLGLRRVRAFVCAEHGVSGAGPRAALAPSRRGVLAISRARRARSHGAQQRLRGTRGAGVRRGHRTCLGAPPERHVRVGRSEGDRHAA